MSTKKRLNDDIGVYRNMKDIVEAYEEIAAMRMRRVKKQVLNNRDFLAGLNDIYKRVVFTYRSHVKKMREKNSDTEAKLIYETNGKTVSVLLSSNTGLYGEITKKTFNLFVKNSLESDTDQVIIGRLARATYDGRGYKKPYKFFEISDTNVEEGELKPVLEHLLQYSNIIVYHGLFKTVLEQDAIKTFVTGEAVKEFDEVENVPIVSIIEPSVEEVTEYFEKQIIASVFEQSVFESSLSKFASRMVGLDIANENIDQLIKRTDFKILKFKHREFNSKQISTLAGVSIWGK
jgi:F0F1-type ATP synthase gamma subunit